jgi:hypothetical protein
MATPTKSAQRRGDATGGHHEQAPTIQPAPSPATDAHVDDAASLAHGRSATAGRPAAAADEVTRHNSTQVTLPLVGTVKLPAPEELAFLGGVGVLALVGAIEWPVAVVLGAGHALATSRRNKVLREFGEALEKA